jgi:hypothetical protein
MIYEFEGYLFEEHRWFGFMALNKRDWSIRKSTPTGFWKMIARFEKLSKKEKKKYEKKY